MSEKRYLLIPAAGVGERMKIGYPKQYFPIAPGKTMLEVTVNRLSEMGFFDEIAVVVSEHDSYIDQCRFAGDVIVLRCGGQTRAQSVLNGLKAWALPDNAWVFVHDAARPCVEKDSVERLIAALQAPTIDGAILALPVTDTLKWVNSEGIVERTIDRSHCCRAQTPQVFRRGALIAALESAREAVTDEASAMEMQGARIKIVEGSAANIKVTYGDDIETVKNFLNAQNSKGHTK